MLERQLDPVAVTAANRARRRKRSRPTRDAILLARFLEEAQITGQLDHPASCPCTSAGSTTRDVCISRCDRRRAASSRRCSTKPGAKRGLDADANLHVFVDDTVYRTAKIIVLGCTPSIASAGKASAAAPMPHVITGSNVRNDKAGLLSTEPPGKPRHRSPAGSCA
jgi:hypothetical protein